MCRLPLPTIRLGFFQRSQPQSWRSSSQSSSPSSAGSQRGPGGLNRVLLATADPDRYVPLARGSKFSRIHPVSLGADANLVRMRHAHRVPAGFELPRNLLTAARAEGREDWLATAEVMVARF